MKAALIKFLFLTALVFACPKYMLAQSEGQEIKKEQKKVSTIHFHVSGFKADSLIEGANIELTSEEPDVNFSKTAVSNNKGIGTISNVPQGKILIQVIAGGWETYGHRFVIDSAEKNIDILLKSSSKP